MQSKNGINPHQEVHVIFSWTEENQGLLASSSHPSCPTLQCFYLRPLSRNSLTNLHQVDDNKRLLQRDSAAPQHRGEGPLEGLHQQQADPPGHPAAVDVGRELGLPLDLPAADTEQSTGGENRRDHQGRHGRQTLTLTGPWPAGRSGGPAGTCLSSRRCR